MHFRKKVKEQISKSLLEKIVFSDSTDKFKITKHQKGSFPAVITISGFLTEDSDNFRNWENSILKLYPDREWFHVEWNNKKLPKRLKKLIEKLKVRTKNQYLKSKRYEIYN